MGRINRAGGNWPRQRIQWVFTTTAALSPLVAALPGWAKDSIIPSPGIPASTPASPSAANLELQNRQLVDRVKALEARVDQLTAASATRAEDVAATNQQIDSDLSLHSPGRALADITGSYAPSVGFVLSSPDGAFSLHPGLVAEFRYMANYRQSIAAKGGGETGKVGDDFQGGFDVTRLRFTLDGTFEHNIGYFIQIQDDQGMSPGLLDAFATYHFSDTPITLKFGQFKDPLWHERNLSEARLLAVDRSLVESLLGGGQTSRVQGAAIIYDQGRLRAQAVIHDGFSSLNTKFYDTGGLGSGAGGGAGVTPTDFGISGRAEYLLLGQRSSDLHPFQEYQQFSSLNAKQDILIAGGGFDWSEAGGNDVFFHTADIQYNSTSGLGAYAAYLGSYRSLTENQGVKPGSYYDPGLVVQASYLVKQKIEPFARFDYTYLAGGATTGVLKNSVQEYTVGMNYYLHAQNAKFTFDGVYLPDGAPADSDALGVLKNSGHSEFLARAQFQLAL